MIEKREKDAKLKEIEDRKKLKELDDVEYQIDQDMTQKIMEFGRKTGVLAGANVHDPVAAAEAAARKEQQKRGNRRKGAMDDFAQVCGRFWSLKGYISTRLMCVWLPLSCLLQSSFFLAYHISIILNKSILFHSTSTFFYYRWTRALY